MKLLLTFQFYLLFLLFPVILNASLDAPLVSITCPTDVTVDTDVGSCVATNPNIGSPTTGGDPGEVVTNDAPSEFPLGATTVTWTVTDGMDTETCTQVVTVEDNIGPRIPERLAWDGLNTVSNVSNPTGNAGYSAVMSLDGDYAVAGARQAGGSGQGKAYILKRNNGVWTEEQEITGSAVTQNSFYGKSVDIKGDFAIVGAHVHETDQYGEGIVYIWERNSSGNWNEVAELLASDRANRDYFGSAVAIDGDVALIGAYGQDDFGSSSGAVYAFERDGSGVWSEVQKFSSNDCTAGDLFGDGILMNGDTAIIAAKAADVIVQNEGAAYVFVRDGTGTWNQVQKITYSGAMPGDEISSTMAIDGNYLVAGRKYYDENTDNIGAAVVFEKDVNGDYQEVQLLIAPDGNYKDFMGGSGVAIHDNVLAVSSLDATAHYNSGAVYMYELQEDDTWAYSDKIRPSNINHHFLGQSLNFHSDGQLVVGAPSFASSTNAEDAVYFINSNTATNLLDAYVGCGESVVAPILEDNCAGPVTGTTSDALPADVISEYNVTWDFDDGNGNQTSYDQLITVYDGTSPALTCGDVTVEVDPDGSFQLTDADLGITYSDACSAVTVLTQPNIWITCSDIGTENYIVQVEDDAGNRSDCVGSVTVVNSSDTVQNLNDAGTDSLRDLINDGCQGDTIFFDESLAGGTLALDSEIDITKNVVVVGLGINDLTLDGGERYRIFHVTADDLEVHLQDMRLINAKASTNGGAIYNEGNLYLSDMIFINNTESETPIPWTNDKDIEITAGTVDIRE